MNVNTISYWFDSPPLVTTSYQPQIQWRHRSCLFWQPWALCTFSVRSASLKKYSCPLCVFLKNLFEIIFLQSRWKGTQCLLLVCANIEGYNLAPLSTVSVFRAAESQAVPGKNVFWAPCPPDSSPWGRTQAWAKGRWPDPPTHLSHGLHCEVENL